MFKSRLVLLHDQFNLVLCSRLTDKAMNCAFFYFYKYQSLLNTTTRKKFQAFIFFPERILNNMFLTTHKHQSNKPGNQPRYNNKNWNYYLTNINQKNKNKKTRTLFKTFIWLCSRCIPCLERQQKIFHKKIFAALFFMLLNFMNFLF